MDIYGAIVRFFQHGGIFMFPIAVVLALGLAVAIERWLYLNFIAMKNKAVWQRIAPMLHAGDLAGVADAIADSNTAIATVLGHGLSRVRKGRDPDEVERAMEGRLMDTIPVVEKRTHYLATLANVATLLGLLGTIMGLIHAFSAVGDANAAEKSALLSFSISEALNCTAFGLLVAIPFMLIHSLLQARAAEIVDSLETAAVKFLDTVVEHAAPTVRSEARVPHEPAPRAAPAPAVPLAKTASVVRA
jgi:biopolymer transport protein ExbB/TolQ